MSLTFGFGATAPAYTQRSCDAFGNCSYYYPGYGWGTWGPSGYSPALVAAQVGPVGVAIGGDDSGGAAGGGGGAAAGGCGDRVMYSSAPPPPPRAVPMTWCQVFSWFLLLLIGIAFIIFIIWIIVKSVRSCKKESDDCGDDSGSGDDCSDSDSSSSGHSD